MPRGESTQKRILYQAIDLFSEKNYKLCTIRELAALVDIKSSSLYKHYQNKDAILQAIFEYYRSNFNKYRTPVDDILLAADTKPLEEVVSMLFYSFGTEGERETMMKITRIVMDLKYENEDAQELFFTAAIDEPEKYLRTVFDALVKAGKLKPYNYDPLILQMVAFANLQFVLATIKKRTHGEIQEQFQQGITLFAKGIQDAGLLAQ